MTDADLDALELAWATDRSGGPWAGCHCTHPPCAIPRLLAEVRRLRAELDRQRAATLATAERLVFAAEVLGRAAERGKVCGCQMSGEATA